MLGEINKNFYCSANCYDDKWCMRGSFQSQCQFERKKCGCYHRKHPTPEQFKEEYGIDYPDDGAVWFRFKLNGYELPIVKNYDGYGEWLLDDFETARAKTTEGDQIICACTPWGCPDNNRKPE